MHKVMPILSFVLVLIGFSDLVCQDQPRGAPSVDLSTLGAKTLYELASLKYCYNSFTDSVAKDVEKESSQIIPLFSQVIMWFFDAGLLPEVPEDPAAADSADPQFSNTPYPYSLLLPLYRNKRDKMRRLLAHFPTGRAGTSLARNSGYKFFEFFEL